MALVHTCLSTSIASSSTRSAKCFSSVGPPSDFRLFRPLYTADCEGHQYSLPWATNLACRSTAVGRPCGTILAPSHNWRRVKTRPNFIMTDD